MTSAAKPSPMPSKVLLHKQSAELELCYLEGNEEHSYTLSAEFLRVHSPSAEVQGHGPGQKKVPLDKRSVRLLGLEAQGNYAIKLIYDDGHDSGIYTWPYLRSLAVNQDTLWKQYLVEAEEERLKRQGESVVKWT